MKKKITIIIIILLSICLFGCQKEEQNEAIEIEEKQLTETEQDNLMTFIDQLTYLDYLNKSFKVNELSNQEVLQFTYDYFSKRGTITNLEFKTLQEYADTYLDFALEPENILCVTHFNKVGGSDYLYLYNIDNGKYTKNEEHETHSNNNFYSDVYNNYISGSKKGTTYTVKVTKAFSDLTEDTTKSSVNFYENYEDAKNSQNKIFTLTYNTYQKTYSKDPLESLTSLESLTTYTYTFKLVDDHYVFISYTIENNE